MFEYVSIISKKQVLERFTQEDIFSYIIKDIVDTERRYYAPYRLDNHPSCFFYYYNDVLFFVDFANIQTHFDCFSLYSKVFSIPMNHVCEHIWNNVVTYNYFSGNSISKSCKKDKRKSSLSKTKIKILEKNWQIEEINYWKQYGITTKQLDNDKVLAIKAFMIETDEMNYSSMINTIGFAYTDFENNHKKIYQPFNKSNKWFTNCTANDVGNIKNLINNGYYLIITKSYKDCRVIRNLGYNCIWFQNEGMCPSTNILNDLSKRFEKIFVFYDNDNAGIIAGEKIKNKIKEFNTNTYNIYLPTILLKKGIKDSSDFVKAISYNELNNFIKNKLEKT